MLQIPDVDHWTGAEAQYLRVTAPRLNCRSTPEIRPDNVLALLHEDDVLIAFYRRGDWVLVQPVEPPIVTGFCYVAHLTPALPV
jgi:hypothetical protein